MSSMAIIQSAKKMATILGVALLTVLVKKLPPKTASVILVLNIDITQYVRQFFTFVIKKIAMMYTKRHKIR